MIVLGEDHLRRIVGAYLTYYHEDRVHQSLEQRPPRGREVEPAENGGVVSLPRVGKLHHQYTRAA